MNSELKRWPLTTQLFWLFYAFLFIFLAVAVGYWMDYAARLNSEPSKESCPENWVCFDPARTTCFIFDMGMAGWQPTQKPKRDWISGLVADGRAEYNFVPNAIDCYDMGPGPILGAYIATLRSEWWMVKRKGP